VPSDLAIGMMADADVTVPKFMFIHWSSWNSASTGMQVQGRIELLACDGCSNDTTI